ncbi:glycosyl transferase [Mycobacterium sp. 852013-51886_SCH5428379]|uniref:glycosyltransferase n=1 Tax=Mycobacterium sp. 852013-51886_SCH5428379 TaxID=1834111 RepID=UPI00080200C4|nr:glycosyltransferase [Mycobacterium sp. 852013-51886_SCH5428379]OBB60124.1 glycosyl transferase [Mycobacterium sp. 852013-51886_SCH5428379]
MSNVAQVAVVVPAHNEVEALPRTLRALGTAVLCSPVPTLIVVVLDSCTDGSERLIGQFGPEVHFVSVDAGNVGAARAAGFDHARSVCADVPAEQTWYATTDADTTVNANWVLRMIDAEVDMVLGTVRVTDWRRYPADVVRRYLRAYYSRFTRTGHGHIHGANMGFRADAYWRMGGFRALASGEDVDLVRRFETAGMRIRRDPELSVATSARRDARAPGGFGAHLRKLSETGRGRRSPGDAA